MQRFSRHPISERVFFGFMGVAMIATVIVGFGPSFFYRAASAPPLAALFHWHGMIATSWMVLFLIQTALIAAHRPTLHRSVGIAGAILAAALTASTFAIAIVSRGLTGRLVFAAGAGLMFALYVVAGLMQRTKPDAHKRLMLLATIALMPPAISRIGLPFVSHDSFGPNFAGLIFLLPMLVYDLATLRRPHPATLWGGLIMIAMLPLRLFLKAHL
jgi:hypothetical protein